jgi:hypothetical protein
MRAKGSSSLETEIRILVNELFKLLGLVLLILSEFSNWIGSYMNGKKHGVGKFNFKNGDMMDCTWRNGKPNGEGVVIEDGIRREVKWSNGVVLA